MRVLVLSLLVLAGCADRPAAPVKTAPKPPRITQFYGNQAVVAKGESLTLCYGTEDAESLRLEPSADGDLRPSLSRCVSETPLQDTTYTLTAKGPGGETKATFTVHVGPAAPSRKALIENFMSVGNTPVPRGGRIQLCYTTEGANSVSLIPPAQATLAPGRNQCFGVTVARTTTYVLTARSADGGLDQMQVTVAVQ